jgi:uncharacterized protein (DUF952 family)
MDPIAHIAAKVDWQSAQKSGAYHPPSLQNEGFIHCSNPSQVLNTANRYFISRQDLVLLWIDPPKIEAELRWEAVHGELFPHIYGPLNLDAIFQVQEFYPGPDGRFTELPGF